MKILVIGGVAAGATADRISYGNTIKKESEIAVAFKLGQPINFGERLGQLVAQPVAVDFAVALGFAVNLTERQPQPVRCAGLGQSDPAPALYRPDPGRPGNRIHFIYPFR